MRDETGRTYTAATVALPSLRLSALHLAVAMAVSSGARLEAAALVSEADWTRATSPWSATSAPRDRVPRRARRGLRQTLHP